MMGAMDDILDRDGESDTAEDELESEDEPDPTKFHIGSALQPPEARCYSTEDLRSLMHNSSILLSPPYQRDVVWSEAKQMKLLDSIYRNYYIPPILFAIYMDEEGYEQRVCIDGKQRLTSIQKFYHGQIAYRDPMTKKLWWYTRTEHLKNKRQEIPEDWKRDFARKEITCVEYRGLSDQFERDLFKRVQEGAPLTASEKLQAVASHWSSWINQLQAQFFGNTDGLPRVVDIDTKRARDFNLLAELVYCCHSYPTQAIPSHAKVEQFVSREDKPTEEFKRSISEVLQEFWFIAADKKLKTPFENVKQRVAPAEFVLIGVLLFLTSRQSHEFRSKEILGMRKFIREKYADIRMRNDIVRDLWAYIQDMMKRIAGRPSQGPRSTATSKAKRKKDTRDEGEEYRPDGTPAKRIKARAK